MAAPETGGFIAALAAFQAELPRVSKDQDANTYSYSYSYADLTAITEAALPLLAKHGLAFSATPTLTESGFVLRYWLVHESGTGFSGDYPLPDPAKSSPQQIGSAITYGRRYCLCSVTGIAPGGEDDDGQKAEEARSASGDPLSSLKNRIVTAGKAVNLTTVEDLAGKFAELNGGLALSDATEAELHAFLNWLDDDRKRAAREHKQLVADVNSTTQAGRTRQDSPDKGRVERSEGVPADDPFYEVAST